MPSRTKKRKAPPVEEVADVDRILDQRSRKGKNEYLCSWMDGAEPQWVDGDQLEGSPVLQEWEYAASNMGEEQSDTPQVIEAKCKELKGWLGEAKRPVFMLGAGISAPVLPTFRGKGGLWTRNPTQQSTSCADVEPTEAHRGLVELERQGRVYWLATQNYDGLSLRSGFPDHKLSELHGNIFVESCPKCLTRYTRDFEVPLESSINHETGRVCDGPDCDGKLCDTIIHFDEALPWKELSMTNAKFSGADLTVVLGSSLLVNPAADLPFKAKRRKRFPPKPKAVIVNLQPTPRDDEADLVIRATCDEVIARLLL